MNYIKIKDNMINEYAIGKDTEFYLSQGFEETDKEIVIGVDNKFYFKGEEPQITPEQREEQFNKEFFQTSIGYVRRKVFIKGTGETGDFLKDFLTQLLFAFAVQGQDIQAIIYERPPMDIEVENWEQYQKTIDWTKPTQQQFLTECSAQSHTDFFG